MAKSKSSASSATRKKHASKKAGVSEGTSSQPTDDAAPPPPSQSTQRGQKKAKKVSRFDPKVKVYVPPPPPPKGAPDPVDLYLGGGKDLDPELVVILRRLGKRDEATLLKGVEALEGWVRDVRKGEGEEEWRREAREEELVQALMAWVSLDLFSFSFLI